MYTHIYIHIYTYITKTETYTYAYKTDKWKRMLRTQSEVTRERVRTRVNGFLIRIHTVAYLRDSGMPLCSCNSEAAVAVLVEAHDQRHTALLAQHLHPCGPARVTCVRVCVCVCVSQ